MSPLQCVEVWILKDECCYDIYVTCILCVQQQEALSLIKSNGEIQDFEGDFTLCWIAWSKLILLPTQIFSVVVLLWSEPLCQQRVNVVCIRVAVYHNTLESEHVTKCILSMCCPSIWMNFRINFFRKFAMKMWKSAKCPFKGQARLNWFWMSILWTANNIHPKFLIKIVFLSVFTFRKWKLAKKVKIFFQTSNTVKKTSLYSLLRNTTVIFLHECRKSSTIILMW